MASFGAGDIIVVLALARKCWKVCNEAPEQFKDISKEVSMLRSTLDEVLEAFEANQPLSPTRTQRLEDGIEQCKAVLKDLEDMLNRYDLMDTQTQRTWQRWKFGLENHAEIKARIVSRRTNLASLQQAITCSSVEWLVKRLGKYAAEHRGGFRQRSVMSSRASASIDDLDADEIKREVADVGIPEFAIDENFPFIKEWLRDAMASGMLEEMNPEIRVDTPGTEEIAEPERMVSSVGQPGPATFRSSEPTQLNSDPWGSSTNRRLASTDLGLDPLELTPSPPAPTRSETVECHPEITNDLFASKWLEYRDKTGQDPDSAPSLTPRTPRRKSSAIASLTNRLFFSSQRIIQAASDGDAVKVSKLLSLGVKVNTTDKWGWTAMSMAAYGGHEEITKILIAAGCSLDHEDVDGDTPLSLAMSKGHRDVVMIIQEEITTRAKEEDEKKEELNSSRENVERKKSLAKITKFATR